MENRNNKPETIDKKNLWVFLAYHFARYFCATKIM